MSGRLPDPKLTRLYRLEATLGEPIELGEVRGERRRIAPLTGGTFDGTFDGTDLSGELAAGPNADWQTILPDGTTLGDIRYTLATSGGALLAVRSQSIRHGSPEVLARLARGDEVDAAEYTFRANTRIESASPEFDWVNKGIFISVGGRLPSAVVYETYLVG
ncbi:MAG TPA: DUF3237 family protein [Solirubrobacteraceae bacterium]|nr:DUF3237 family protein [Solirubrobacteraceae bacterium]